MVKTESEYRKSFEKVKKSVMEDTMSQKKKIVRQRKGVTKAAQRSLDSDRFEDWLAQIGKTVQLGAKMQDVGKKRLEKIESKMRDVVVDDVLMKKLRQEIPEVNALLKEMLKGDFPETEAVTNK